MSKPDAKTLNEGAVKGGDGNFIFRLMDMDGIKTGERYSSAVDDSVDGAHVEPGAASNS